MTKSAAGCKELCCSKRLRAGACFLEQPWAKTRHNICKEKTGFRQTEIAMVKFKRTVLVCVLLIASSLAQGPTTFHPGFNFFSRQQDVQLGQESAAQVRRQMQIVKDPFLNDYVNRVGRKLANTPEARASGFPFTFEVVADPSINAFALPGGPMFINTGLLKAVDNEAELAGVLAHEMSHVILRHGTNQASKANLIQIPALLAAAVTGSNLLAQLTNLGATGLLLRFSRTDESEADASGTRIMNEAGYNPIEMAHF